MGTKKQVGTWMRRRGWRYPFAVMWLLVSSTTSAFALPWDSPLSAIANSLDGPVAKTAAMIIVGFTGLMIAFGEHKGIFATVMRVLFGLSLAIGVMQWLPALGL